MTVPPWTPSEPSALNAYLNTIQNEFAAGEAQVTPAIVPTATAPTTASDPSTTWLSASLQYMRVDSGPQNRTVHTNIAYEEASVWFANGIWNMIVDSQGNSPCYYYSCSGDPMVNGNWGGKTTLFGSGSGGFAHQMGEPYVFVQGDTLYMTFLDITSNVVKMATAPITTPTVWTILTTPVLTTAVVLSGQASNAGIAYAGGVYYLFIEVSGGSSPGIYVATSTSLLTTFTLGARQTTLRAHAGQPAGPFLDGDGVTWVMFYTAFTGTTVQGGWPVGIWRATNTNLATDTWVTTDCFMLPALNQESSSIADPFFAQGPNGSWLLFYTACHFRGSGTYIASTPFLPTYMQWTGTSWARSQPGGDPAPPAASKEQWLRSINAGEFPKGRRVTPGRGSQATYYNSSGVRSIAALYVARAHNYNFHNGSTWVDGGVLNEGQSVNMLPWSSVLANAVWNYNSCTRGADSTTDVAGVVATMITAAAANTAHRVALAAAPGSNRVTYAFSVDVKAGTSQYIYLALQGTTNDYATVVFNLTGTAQLAATQTSVGSAGGVIVSAIGENIGNTGWWRLSLVGSVSFATINTAVGLAGAATGNVVSGSGSVTFNAAGTETIYLSSPQLEPGSTVTSYIPTIGPAMGAYSGAAVRNADPTAANPCTTSAGTWALDTTTSGMIYNARSFNSTSAKNDAISFDLNLGDHNPMQWVGSNYVGATYHIRLLCHTGPANGIVSVNIVNVENVSLYLPASNISYFCGNIDTYSSGDTYNVEFECNDVTIDVMSPGRMALYLTVTDKNASSSNYLFGWHQISIYRVDI